MDYPVPDVETGGHDLQLATGHDDMRSGYPHGATPAGCLEVPTWAEIGEVVRRLDACDPVLALETLHGTLGLGDLERRLWPDGEPGGATKRDLLRYYARVSPHLLPYLAVNAIDVTCYPVGVAAMPRRSGRDCGFRERVLYPRTRIHARNVRYRGVYVTRLADLLLLGGCGAISLQGSGRSPTDEEDGQVAAEPYPVSVEFDLGPLPERDRPCSADDPRERAFRLREAARSLGLVALPRTSGRGTLWCRVVGDGTFGSGERPPMLAALARAAGPLARAVTRPCAPLSPSADRRGLVSMPLSWSDVDQVRADDFSVFSAPDLLQHRGDPWARLLASERSGMAVSRAWLAARPFDLARQVAVTA